MKRALNLTEEFGGSEIYKVDILTCIWRYFPASVIHRYWNHAGLVDSGSPNAVSVRAEVVIENEVWKFLCQVSRNERVTNEDYLNPEDENDSDEEADDKGFVFNILAEERENNLTHSDSDGRTLVVVVLLPPNTGHLVALALCKRMCEHYRASVNLRKQLATL